MGKQDEKNARYKNVKLLWERDPSLGRLGKDWGMLKGE